MSKEVTRRTAVGGLTILAAARPVLSDETSLVADAKTEDSLTWYSAQVDAETSEKLGRTFTKRYPGVDVAVIRTTGQVAYQRRLMDIKNHTPNCEVFKATDISHLPILKEKGQLTEYKSANATSLLPAFQSLSDPGWSYVTNASRYFLIYNKDLVRPEKAPKSWLDLLDPRWKGRVATGHPAFSGCTGTWAVGLRKLLGLFREAGEERPASRPFRRRSGYADQCR